MAKPKDPTTLTERRKLARQVRKYLQVYLIRLDPAVAAHFPDVDMGVAQLACLIDAQHDLSELIDAQKEAMAE